MDINQYVKDYDFTNYTEKFKEEFKQRVGTEKYLSENSEDNFMKFTKEFWQNPNISLGILKKKFNINNQIPYSDIIKAYPTDTYIKLLKMYYSNSSMDDLTLKFGIPSNKVERIIIPIIVENSESYCPRCFNNSFIIGNNSFAYRCERCHSTVDSIGLLTCEQAKLEMQRVDDEKKARDKKIEEYEKILEGIKCPKCNEKLYLTTLPVEPYNYQIICDKCSYISFDIDKTVSEFSTWKQRAAMMIAIKAKEQELIEKALDGKKEKDIFFIKEDIIVGKENNDTAEFLAQISTMDNIELWRELFKRIRSCNRLEKKVLIEIIELAKNEGEQRSLPIRNEEVKLYSYRPEEPIVYNLIKKTKVIVMRQTLRRLMSKNLITVSEESLNCIIVPKVLIDNLEAIKNLMVVKDINPNVRYLIFQRENFTCMTCGETGRPLKIAYLTSDKNINDLNGLMALCDNCHEVLTRNEILIDGEIVGKGQAPGIKLESSLKSLEFLTVHHSELKGDETVIKTLENWECDYSLSDIIKALTVTIDKIKKNKIEGTVTALLNYTNGILKKTIETGNHVSIYEGLMEQYGVEKWIG